MPNDMASQLWDAALVEVYVMALFGLLSAWLAGAIGIVIGAFGVKSIKEDGFEGVFILLLGVLFLALSVGLFVNFGLYILNPDLHAFKALMGN